MAEENKEKTEKITKSESFVSVVTILGKGIEKIVNQIPEIEKYLSVRYSDFEIVLVVDQSAQEEAARLLQPLF